MSQPVTHVKFYVLLILNNSLKHQNLVKFGLFTLFVFLACFYTFLVVFPSMVEDVKIFIAIVGLFSIVFLWSLYSSL